MRFKFDKEKSKKLKDDPRRNIGLKEVQEIWRHDYFEDGISDIPEQYRAMGWVGGTLYSVIFEYRTDDDGEYIHLITLWKSTSQEKELYEENFNS